MADEFSPPMPVWKLSDPTLEKLCKAARDRLPAAARQTALRRLDSVSEISEWTGYIKDALASLGINRNCAKFNTNSREIQISKRDCGRVSDDVIVGAFVHEVAHAFQTQTTPDNIDAIEYAGDALPSRWCFSKEIAALIVQREKDNPCVE